MRTNTTRVAIRWDEFDRLTIARGWKTDSERARRIGIHPSTLANLRRGCFRPGAVVCGRVLTALEAPYASLFVLENEPAELAS